MKELKSALDEIVKGGNEAQARRVTELLNTIDWKSCNMGEKIYKSGEIFSAGLR